MADLVKRNGLWVPETDPRRLRAAAAREAAKERLEAALRVRYTNDAAFRREADLVRERWMLGAVSFGCLDMAARRMARRGAHARRLAGRRA